MEFAINRAFGATCVHFLGWTVYSLHVDASATSNLLNCVELQWVTLFFIRDLTLLHSQMCVWTHNFFLN